ncbi:MAG: 2-amino-4-hydroxy-6-hydroxymethyldihydropteridine diphosphokinase [Desulfobacteraceae bacterium]|nr:2-amino-4-hydroxy-6-hydroxymethyldihydropteridine diphosphokinase [Desulfobacteraceae bacterium]
MAKTAFIGIGSNLGDKLKNCLKSIELIHGLSKCHLVAKSDFYRTEPVGVEGQDWYANGAISLKTDLSAQELLTCLLEIEEGMGRVRRSKWGPRTIDLDILLFGRDIVNEEDLAIPHPLMHQRRFVLVPMVQLAPDLVHPVLGKTMSQLLETFSAKGQSVIKMEGK